LEHDVLNGRRVGMGVMRFTRERQCREQLLRVDRVGECLKQLERPEPPLQQVQALAIGPALGDLAQQLQPRAILEALAGNHDVELVLAQQVDAVGLVRHGVDYEVLAQRAHCRFQHR
jgi:hypothetical protein